MSDRDTPKWEEMSANSEPRSDRGEWVGTTSLQAPATNRAKGDEYGTVETDLVEVSRPEYRTASVSTDSNGDPLPIVIVAGPEELAESGIDLRRTNGIRYRWVDGRLVVRSED